MTSDEEIYNAYLDGHGIKEIAKHYKIPENVIRQIIFTTARSKSNV